MPPRANERLDFTPILTHYLFLFTTFLAVISWFLAFIAQAYATAKLGRSTVGVLWFAIFLQLFLIVGVLYTLASDSIAMHRFQVAIFGAIAIVFAVLGVNQGIFAGAASLNVMGAGWLVLAIVDVLWVLYFTSEDDSLALHIFNSMGTGGLTPPSRRRRTRTQASIHNASHYSGAGISSLGPYETKPGRAQGSGTYSVGGAGGVRSQNSFVGSIEAGIGNRSPSGTGGAGPNHQDSAGSAKEIGPHSPLMVGVGAGGSGNASSPGDPESPREIYRAKALYAYTANPDDPSELSFEKGENLDILDKSGKWWHGRKEDGTVGIVPSNYLQMQ